MTCIRTIELNEKNLLNFSMKILVKLIELEFSSINTRFCSKIYLIFFELILKKFIQSFFNSNLIHNEFCTTNCMEVYYTQE